MRLSNIIKWAAGALALACVAACNDEFNEIKNLRIERCLQPLNLSGSVDMNTGVDATFSWDLSKGTEQYRLVIFNSADSSSVLDLMLLPEEVPFYVALEADGSYSFRVCGIAESRDSSRWAWYDGSPLKTYAIKDNLFLEVTGRTSSSISLAWSKDFEDYKDVSHIEFTPVAGGDVITYTLTEADKTSATATVSGLSASCEYNVVLYFKSASRGAVNVRTNPEQGSLVKVTTAADLIAALEAGNDVYLGLEGSPYEIGELAPAKGFRLIGECDADGNRPVVKVNMTLGRAASETLPAVDYAGGDIYFENIAFDGKGGRKFIFDHKTGDLTIENFTVVNCEIFGYNGGLLYQSTSAKLTLDNLLIDGCEIHDLQDVKGEGEFFDVRSNGTIGTVTFRNSTLWNSSRALIRVDNSSTSINHVVLENNTFKRFDVGQNKGILYIRCPWSEMTVKKNLFLWEEGSDTRFATTGKADNATEGARRPSTINAEKNYYYEAGSNFLPETAGSSFTNFTRTQIAATSLSEDPCVNSKGNVFNVTNQTLLSSKIGAAKWLVAYVEPEEDLTLGLTEAPHTWDFSDATLFSGDLSKSKVRDGLMMVASEACPMNLDGALKFGGATALSSGIPADGYAAFKVNAAGSVLVKVSEADGMLVIATGDADGSNAVQKAGLGAAAGIQKVVLEDISGETLVYLYTTGAATVTALSWSTDIEGVNTALAAPVPAIDVRSVYQGDTTTITVSWQAVNNAASYDVSFNGGAAVNTTECSYVIDSIAVSKLEAGSYTVSVTAKPASTDLYNTASSPATVAFAVLAAPEEQGGEGGETTYVETTIGADFSSAAWQTAFGTWEGATSGSDCTNPFTATVEGFTVKIVKTGEKNRYGSNYIQFGGGGNKEADNFDENRTIKFTAPAEGTLKVVTSTTGNTADLTRSVSVTVNGGTKQTKDGAGVAANDVHAELSFEIDEAGDVLIIPEAGLRFYTVSFTYMKASSEGGDTPAQKEEHFAWDFSSADWQTAFGTWEGATSGSDCTNPFSATVDGLTLKIVKTGDKNRYASSYFQFGGAGNNDEANPENRTLSFTCTTAGTLTVTTSTTGNTADLTRSVSVTVNGGTKQTKDGAGVAANDTHAELSFEVGAGRILIWPEAGLRFYKVTFDSK